jgi:hypothetical protein
MFALAAAFVMIGELVANEDPTVTNPFTEAECACTRC